jgi:hypothetical protein
LPLSRGLILRSFYAPVLKTPETTARLFAALALALILQGVAAPAALAQAELGMGARSWVLADAESGEYLAGENASERLSMGSTDKIMVALVALSSRASEALLREGPWVRDGALAVLRLATIRRRIGCPRSLGVKLGKGKEESGTGR